MRKMRKLLSAIIALLLVMGLSPAMPAKADETETISITYTSTVNDGDAPVLPTISSGYEFVGSTFIEDTNKNDTFHDDKVMVMDQATLQAMAAQMNVTPDDLIALSAAQGVTIMKTFRSGYNYAFTGQIKRSDNTAFSGADGDPFTGIIYVNGTDKTSRFEISDGLIAVPNDSGIIYECGSSATTKTLTGITITTAPTTTVYSEGQTFNPAGMIVTATYSDNSTAKVSGYTVSPSGALATTDTSVTISYTEGNITKAAMQAITVNPASSTTETIDITYTSKVNDGDAPALPTISSGYEFVGSTFIEDTNKNDTFHDDKVMVMDQATLQAMADQLSITPEDLISVAAAQGSTIRTTFRSGYNYAFTGQIKRSDNTLFSGADGDPFTGIIYVNGTDKTSEFEISDGLIAVPHDSGIIYTCVSSGTTKTLKGITITTAPATTTYAAGQNFDPAGMVVTATYSDNSTAEVTGYTVSPSGALATTDTNVTISYTEDGVTRTATQKITVSPAGTTVFAFTLQPADGTADFSGSCTFTWALNSAPDSIELESWSTSGTGWGSIKPLTYAEGTMSDSVSYVSWYDIASRSTYRIRATKGSDTIYSDVFEVKWTGNEPSEHYNTLDCIEITTAPDTTAYTAGQKFDPAGMVITAKYFNASDAVVTNYTISPSGGLATTDTSVTISYTEGNITKTATQKITVNPGTNSFKITFDANGHGTAPAAQTVESGKTATKPSDPTASGWTFGGWYTEATCANAFDFSKAIAADFTLYAKWTENKASEETTYIVTVGANGSVTQGNVMTITVKRSVDDNTCFSHFTGVQIDGKACAAGDYDAKAGSTVVTLKAATIENLSVGTHTISILFDDGKAETKVTVEAKASEETDPTENAGTGEAGNSDGNGKVQSPKTGDDRTDFFWVLLILTALCACGVVVMNGKCRNTGA